MTKRSDNDEALIQCCRDLKLPNDLAEHILSHVVSDLRDVESRKSKTQPLRRRELEQVKALALQLNTLVQGLDIEDRDRIESVFADSTLRLTVDPPNPLEAVFKGLFQPNMLRIGDVLLTLAQSASRQSESLQGGSNGGRPSVLPLYAWCVGVIARLVAPHGVSPGRGGDFEVLCEAAFEAAGVISKPDNAIRLFMRDILPFLSDEWLKEQGVETPDEKGL